VAAAGILSCGVTIWIVTGSLLGVAIALAGVLTALLASFANTRRRGESIAVAAELGGLASPATTIPVNTVLRRIRSRGTRLFLSSARRFRRLKTDDDARTARTLWIPDVFAPVAAVGDAASHKLQSPGIWCDLKVFAGPDAGKGASLSQSQVTFGRAGHSTFQLSDPSVSNEQATILVEHGSALVADNGSTNGTYVNDRRIATYELKNNDVLGFGTTRILVKLKPGN
jgi:hypothetical protein